MNTPERWWDSVDWWESPALSYARGVVDGFAAGRAERDAVDDDVHRAAVREVLRIIERADLRAAADAPGARPGDYQGPEGRAA